MAIGRKVNPTTMAATRIVSVQLKENQEHGKTQFAPQPTKPFARSVSF
jgi:hypothetical protein